MNAILLIAINGFLFSIFPSMVTDNKSASPSPIIQENRQDEKPLPLVHPQYPQPPNNGGCAPQCGKPATPPAPKAGC